MKAYSRDYYRSRALQRRRDPDQDARNEAAASIVRERVQIRLSQVPLIQRLNAAANDPDADMPAPAIATDP